MNTAGSTAFLNGKEATVNRKQDYTLYDYLNWIKVKKQVSKLQTRIAKAVMSNKTRLRKRLSYMLRKSYYARLLKSNHYKSKPLKRIYIEKKGKKKKRPLSIPCMIDRAVTDLPQPLSPTMPSVSPAWTSIEMPSTAVT